LSKKRIVTLIVLGIAIAVVPFLLRFLDRKQAEDYINRIGVTEDEEDEESETGGGKKKTSPELSKGAIGIIEIESLNIRYPIFEGAGAEQLNMGIGHLPETAGLLKKGNCVLAGHNGSRRGTFFTNLSSIAIGVEVKVTDKEMVTHTYIVEDTGVVGPYDASVRAESDEERLTLFTCAYHGTQRFVCRCRLATDNNE
jgi:LPXTG-site transpeptidase (sortase) family protein